MSRATDNNSTSHVIVRQCLDDSNLRMINVSEALGEIPQTLGQQMRESKSLKFDRFIEILGAIGYGIEVKPLGCRRVCREYAQKVMNEKKPLGLFYVDDDEGCFAVENREGQGTQIQFMSKDIMFDWLNASAK